MQWSIREIAGITGGTIIEGRSAGRVEGPTIGRLSIDTRTLRSGDLFLAIAGDRYDGHDFVDAAFAQGAVAAVISRPPDGGRIAEKPLVLVPDTLAALHALAARARAGSGATVIAVTGSSGKTTTREMTALALSASGPALRPLGNRNNHIGLPLTLLDLAPEHRWAVLELGMNHPGEIASLSRLARPHIALITNVGRAHSGPVGGVDAIRAAKLEIAQGLIPGGVLVLPDFDAALLGDGRRSWPRVETFGFTAGADHRIEALESTRGGVALTMAGLPRLVLPAPGRPAALAAAAALAIVRIAGASMPHALDRLAGWRPLPGRMSVMERDGVVYLDDSYNANPESMAAALETLRDTSARRRIAVLGEMRELGAETASAHRELGTQLQGIDVLVLIGDETANTEEVAREARPDLRITRARTTGEVLSFLRREVRAGDVVLVKGSRAVGLDEVIKDLTGSGGTH